MQENVSYIDKLLVALDIGLRSCFHTPTASRPSPVASQSLHTLKEADRRHSAGLMRINHTGEVCAQALYQGQALATRTPELRETLKQSAQEENDHLNWCHQRLTELEAHTSLLNPLWYGGSLLLGYCIALCGDKWNLGFLAETERQVCRHIDSHLSQLPQSDQASREILKQMYVDEQKHATTAVNAGAAELPAIVKGMMKFMSKVMTSTVYHL